MLNSIFTIFYTFVSLFFLKIFEKKAFFLENNLEDWDISPYLCIKFLCLFVWIEKPLPFGGGFFL
ncbi:MAG: hypothetical protein RL757_1349, partial [Bacteroidota bacterium]